jgi:hypothetical protein
MNRISVVDIWIPGAGGPLPTRLHQAIQFILPQRVRVSVKFRTACLLGCMRGQVGYRRLTMDIH